MGIIYLAFYGLLFTVKIGDHHSTNLEYQMSIEFKKWQHQIPDLFTGQYQVLFDCQINGDISVHIEPHRRPHDQHHPHTTNTDIIIGIRELMKYSNFVCINYFRHESK